MNNSKEIEKMQLIMFQIEIDTKNFVDKLLEQISHQAMCHFLRYSVFSGISLFLLLYIAPG